MTTYEPGLYYASKTGSEVRKLLGQNPKQGDLFKEVEELPAGRWAYLVIWSTDKDREGMAFSCLASSFKKWGSLLADQGWWKRVEGKQVRHFAPLDIWIDGDEIVAPGVDCYNCGGHAKQRFPAKDLREFLR